MEDLNLEFMEQGSQTTSTGQELSRKLLDVSMIQNTRAPASSASEQLGFTDWQLAVTIVLAVVGFIALSAAMAWLMAYKRKAYIRRQQFNERMSHYYDSISITGNMPSSYDHTASNFRDSVSTIFTVISTPTSSRKASLTNSLDKQSSGKTSTPTTHVKTDYKFSLEDTLKKLKELDNDNIAQIRNAYCMSQYEEDSCSLNLDSEQAIKHPIEDGEDLDIQFQEAVLKLDHILYLNSSES